MYYNYLVVIILNSIFIYLFCLQYFEHPQTFQLEEIYKPSIVSSLESPCPKVIYQIVPNLKEVPSGLYHTIMHNIRINPEFEYKIYDYNSALKVLETEFGKEEVDAYTATDSYQIKTDYFKYALIYKYGGIFLDIKYICYTKFIDLLKYNDVFYVQINRNDDIELSLLVSHNQNPAIKNAFNLATKNLKYHNYCDEAKKITGGAVVRDELYKYGYLTNFVKLFIDNYHTVRLKHSMVVILKKYKSFDIENQIFGLLPSVMYDYNKKILYGELPPAINIDKKLIKIDKNTT